MLSVHQIDVSADGFGARVVVDVGDGHPRVFRVAVGEARALLPVDVLREPPGEPPVSAQMVVDDERAG